MKIINPYRFGSAGPVTLVSDTFTDTDSTALASHTPDTDTVGGGWVVVAGTFTITGNAVYQTATPNTQYPAYIETNVADVVISCDVATDINEPARVLLRYSNSTNYWGIEIHKTNNTFKIREYNGGTFTDRASASVAINAGQFYTIAVTASGSTITATIDGANEISYSSATHNQTATKHGIQCYGDGEGRNAWDNLTITAV